MARGARIVAAELLRLFSDAESGGFFTTGSDAEQLVVRLKDLFDDATPSANSLAANGLLRLAALTGDTAFEAPAVEVMTMLAPSAAAHPNGFANLLGAIERFVTAPAEIAIVGADDDPRTRALRREVTTRLIPASVTLTGSAPDASAVASDTSPLLAGRELRTGAPTAYVCEHYACRQPVTEPRRYGPSSIPFWRVGEPRLSRRRGRNRPRAPRRRPSRKAIIAWPRAASSVPTSDAIFAPPVALTALVSSTARHGGLRPFTATRNSRSSKWPSLP